MTPKLTIVGAGPGDADLITLKAIKAIKSADVILYDALINRELLEYASSHAELIFVGKRKGCYSYQQTQINELIVERALRCGHVVRLKGGDSFIFGRGAEELEHAKAYAIEVAVVPGISSSAAVPASVGIPLTKRNAAQSFWVITGTTKTHEISGDIALAAKSTATVVILMGMSKLSEIVQIFSHEGKSEMAIAVIQNGTRVNEKVGIGTISNIESIVEEKQLSNPAIIIIGEVVNQRVDLSDIYSQADLAHANSRKQIA
jgi:uroporphyrin-III C-methyltransferase